MSPKIILGIILLILGGFFLFSNYAGNNSSDGVVCTMEAKLCPDGSYVGRTGPKCEFAECPDETIGGGGGGILPYKSGISGTVLRGPICPVVRADEPCPDAPYSTSVTVYYAKSSSPFVSIKSGADGKFLFNLPPGDYRVDAANEGISKVCSPVLVTVGPDEVENITLSCDTGIR